METFNLQEIQEMTCIAISKQDWVKNIIQQIKDAAAKGEKPISSAPLLRTLMRTTCASFSS